MSLVDVVLMNDLLDARDEARYLMRKGPGDE
jgi:hypothetical protein